MGNVRLIVNNIPDEYSSQRQWKVYKQSHFAVLHATASLSQTEIYMQMHSIILISRADKLQQIQPYKATVMLAK